MTKKLLIVIDSLGSGGAEKSLINLLSFIDYSRVSVDLLLFGRGGINEEFLPDEINVLPVIKPESHGNWLRRFSFYIRKIVFSLSLRIYPPRTANDDTRRIWKLFSKNFISQPTHYDVAFAYAQRLPSLYVAEKVSSDAKYSWMNVTIHHSPALQKYYSRFFRKFTKIVCVSDTACKSFIENYPQFRDKTETIYDIVNPDFVLKLSRQQCKIRKKTGVVNILTVARLNFEQKGYDILIEVCNELKKRGFQYHWNILGEGRDKGEIELMITKYGLESFVSLLGTVPNPYPYFINSDIYVQTSRYEGYGLSIAEARLLNIPVVTTAYDCVDLQINNGVNGIITSYHPEEIANAIQQIMSDESLYNDIVANLKIEQKGNIDEFKKIQSLIGY